MMPDSTQANDQTLARLSELFGAHKAEWLGPRLFELFSAPNYFPQMITSRPCILVGGRGTGKTTVLRSLSYTGQFELHDRDANSVATWPYYGFYSRVDTNRVAAFKGPELTEAQWGRHFAHYTNLLMCLQVLRFLSWFHYTTGLPTELPDEDLSRIASALALPSPSNNAHLIQLLDDSLIAFEAHINNVADGSGFQLSLQGAPVNRLLEAVKRNEAFVGKLFFFLIDEYENLEDYQQRIINTLIKHSGELYTFKVCVRELGWRVRNTLAENESLISPADYTKIDIAEVMQGSQFERFSYRVCQDRLMALVEQSDNALTEIKDLLPSLSEEREAELLGIHEHNHRVLQELRNIAPTDAVEGLTAMQVYLLNYWRQSRNESLERAFAEFQENPAAWRTRLNNYRHALLFTIRKGRPGIRKYYAGWDTFIHLAGGNIRFLLQLVEVSLARHLREGSGLDKPVSPTLQTEAAQATGRMNLTELEGLSVHGAKMAKLLLSLGRVFGIMAASPEGHAPEVNQFEVPDPADESSTHHEVSDLLNAAVMHLALDRRSGSKLASEGDTRDWDYTIYPIFAPFFNFSYRRKRKMHLTPDQVLALVNSPNRGIREVLAASNRTPDDSLPEQLRLFEMFYADSH